MTTTPTLPRASVLMLRIWWRLTLYGSQVGQDRRGN